MRITGHQKAKLKELFPEVFTEGSKIDFDQLKRTLGEMVDSGKERFGMQWAGKEDCLKIIQQPSVATLVPVPEESVYIVLDEGFQNNASLTLKAKGVVDFRTV